MCCSPWGCKELDMTEKLTLSRFSSVAQSYLTLCNPRACQDPLSMEFSRQEYCSGLLFSSPGDLPDPGMEPGSPALQADFVFTV